MRRNDVFRYRLDGVGDVAEEVRVPEVETDAGRLAFEPVVEDGDERRRVREPVRDDFHRDAHAERLGGPSNLIEAPQRRAAVIVVRMFHAGRRPEVQHQKVDELSWRSPGPLRFRERPRHAGRWRRPRSRNVVLGPGPPKTSVIGA